MSGLDKRHTGNAEQGPESRSPGGPAGPLFPGASAGRPGTVPSQEAPLGAPPAQQQVPPPRGVLASGPNALPMTLHGSSGDLTSPVEGRITIGDTVIEKIAALAALEVAGVAALAAQAESPGNVRVLRRDDEEVTIDVAIAVEYGIVIKDVAKVVKANVARVAGLMLGMRVAAVNVSVEDVRHAPAGQAPARA